MPLIYCLEDDESIRELILYALKTGDFQGRGFERGAELWPALEEACPALLLLDILLPGEDGLQILQRLRSVSRTKDLPVILLTAKTTEYDKVKGLDLGADDYLTKPFGVMELLSRIRAVLRRAGSSGRELLQAGNVKLDYPGREVTVDGVACELTYKELELLHLLLQNKGVVLSRDRIMEAVWGFDFEGESRTVDMHIKTLRQKLGQQGVNGLILTVRNVGYQIKEL